MAKYLGFKLRADIFVDQDLVDIAEWVKSVGSAHLLVEEAKEAGHNRHVHAALFVNTTEKALRNKWLYRFKKTHSGNKSYSLRQLWEDEETHVGYYRYMCKGEDKDTPPVVISAAGIEFGADKIKIYHEEYYQHPAQQVKRKRQVTDETIEDEVLRLCKERKYTPGNTLAICQCLVKTYKRRQKGFTEYELERKMNYVLGQLDDDDSWANDVAERLCRKMQR